MPAQNLGGGQNPLPLTRSVAGATDVYLPLDNAQHEKIILTGALTGNISVYLPVSALSAGHRWRIQNDTTGAFTLTVKGQIGSGVAVTQGSGADLRWTGADMEYDDPNAIGDGTVGAPGISFALDLDTGWWRPTTNTMAASVGGSEVIRFASTGITTFNGTNCLQINGATTPASGFHVLITSLAAANIPLRITTHSGQTGFSFVIRDSGGNGRISFGNCTQTTNIHMDLRAVTGQTGNFVALRDQDANIITVIDAAGRVGVGKTTSLTHAFEALGTADDILSGSMRLVNSNAGTGAGAVLQMQADACFGYVGAFSAAHTAVSSSLADRIGLYAGSTAAGITIMAPTASQTIAFRVATTGLILSLETAVLRIAEGANFIAGTATGTKIGVTGGAAGEKWAFFGATPIVQPLLATGAGATVDNVITALQNLGLVRQS